METNLLLSLTAFCGIILLGFFSELLFDKTHIPDVLILFLVGMLFGPIMNWIDPSSFSAIEPVFVTLALILIIFEGGLTIKIHDFLKGAFPGTTLSLLFFLSCLIIVTSIMIIFGYPLHLSLLLGAILGGTSSAVVMPIVKLLKLSGESSLILTLESTITDVFCIVGAITITEVIKLNQFNAASTLISIISTFFIALFIGVIAGLLWILARQKFQQIQKAYMISVAYIILIYVAAEIFNANGAIAILAFGMFLGNFKKIVSYFGQEPEYNINESEKTFYSEISFFLKVLFFVYLGIIIDFSNPFLFLIGLLITILIAIVRPFIVKISINKKEISQREITFMNIMTPKGLAPAVLAQITLKSEFFSNFPEVNDLIIITLSVILFSIILTSFLVFYYEKFVFKEEKKEKTEQKDKNQKKEEKK